MTTDAAMTVLYTYRIRGDLAHLPRLYTFIRRLRGELAEGRVFLVDLGESCMPEVWPCAITGGRSTLLVLDAMGFHAVNCDGLLTADSRAKLVDHVGLYLVDSAHPHVQDQLQFVTHLIEETSPSELTICLSPSDETSLEGNILRLKGVESKQVGLVRINQGRLYHEVHDLPAETPPDPTISGAVDFVHDEARYFEKRQQGK